jgi:nucleoid DNA-binding protein
MGLSTLTQSELANELAERTGWNRADAKRALAELETIVAENVGNCVRVKVAGVVIEPKLKKASKKRKGRNPATGEEVEIAAKPASVKVKARALSALQKSAPSTRKLQNAL